uniref:ATP synthase subunit delta, organellar chromatophore n=1 Tax=Paulinella chromatophora TaxID=39717 RepID=ATPD_PAUCH|nr:ATP synthase, delta (OSCP) subunit [Paulinella chromatophora]B1X3Y5.1 RecName: Full=ATP synthase subunit delta, organellar chromatophore; AltName: Full=ATP synthase F(1) sector subunit delta; AltName: Full=F-type ATPase subunit delta [Paulinella chromatophora]ACB42654.1 ATP synthase, delta (OSCP) subunit [Paulinella chromatophora]
MPLLNSIATPYSEALLQVAEARGESEQTANQVKELLQIWESSPELRNAMTSQVLEPEAKKAALMKLFSEQLTPAFTNLLKLLADRKRISALEAVLLRFLELYRDIHRIALAEVTSAIPLNEEQKELLRKKIQVVAGTNNVELKLLVDPSMIGGFIVSVGSQVIDASLAGQVRRLGLALAKLG